MQSWTWPSTVPAISKLRFPSGESAYTRDGKFNRGQDGQIVTMDGFPLTDGIIIPG
jgi:flagellar basal-body rod protein FlgG